MAIFQDSNKEAQNNVSLYLLLVSAEPHASSLIFELWYVKFCL